MSFRTRRTAALLCLVLALTGCSDKKEKPATTEQLLQAGLTAVAQKNDEAAVSAFLNVIEKDPDNVYAHYNLGTIYQRQGFTARALQEYGQSLAADPKYVPALFNEATIYGETNPTLAITTYKQVIALQPVAPTAYLNLGLLEAKVGLFDQARKDLQKALDQDRTLVNSIPKDVFAKETPKPSPRP